MEERFQFIPDSAKELDSLSSCPDMLPEMTLNLSRRPQPISVPVDQVRKRNCETLIFSPASFRPTFEAGAAFPPVDILPAHFYDAQVIAVPRCKNRRL